MISVRKAETDADLELWRRVRIGVLPDERAPTLAELRQMEEPDRLSLLAALDGRICGSGVAHPSNVADSVTVTPRVLPSARRRGIGSALLRSLVAHAVAVGARDLIALTDDDGSTAFAERFGFKAVDRQVKQVKTIGEERAPEFPPGLEVATVAERPELLAEAYELAVEAYADMATFAPVSITREEWLREESTHPAGSFVALADGEVVGYSGLMRDADDPSRAEDGLTAVRRDWRRRGLASALKRAELSWAADHGLHEIYTWTQEGNEAMRRVNEQLGYENRAVSLTMCTRLHVAVDAVGLEDVVN
jgi:mycothiol synthase